MKTGVSLSAIGEGGAELFASESFLSQFGSNPPAQKSYQEE